MKKNIISLIFVFVFLSVFSVSALIPKNTVLAQSTNISQLVELLISIGVIAPDKAVLARTVISTIATSTIATTSSVVTAISPEIKLSTTSSFLQITAPNGGEEWQIDLDVPYVVKWNSDSVGLANIAFVSSNSRIGSCLLNPAPVKSRDGANTYNVLLKTAKCYNQTTGTSTELKDGTYRAKVYYKDSFGTTIEDEGNSTFRILPVPIPSLKITSPNGGESWLRNREYEIKYTLNNVDDSIDDLIYYYIMDNNGNNVSNGRKAMRNGKFDLEIPSSLSVGAYKIKLKLTTNKKVPLEDVSDSFFWIASGL